MTAAFGWLNDLMVWFGKWVPRIVLVRASHEGVRFGRNGTTARLMPGVHFYWPLVQEVTLVSTAQRVLYTCPQLIGSEVVDLAVAYQITNAVQVAVTFYNFAAQLESRAKAALAHSYRKDIESAQLCAGITEALQQAMRDTGITVDSVHLLQRGWTIPIKNMSDWGVHEMKELA